MLSGREATERGRPTGRIWKGGVFSPTDSTADPGKAAPAVAAALIKIGRHYAAELRSTGHRSRDTRRGDGSYNLAISSRGRVDPTPQLLRFAPQFVPMFAKRWRNVFPGGLEGLRSGHETLARWRLDAPTPMERMRIFSPRPDPAAVRQTCERAGDRIPAVRNTSVASAWAGFVDSTPDGVPGIGEVAELPGFTLASSFSGHGFGICPGAGHLIADLVTGAETIFNPTPYDPARFRHSAFGMGQSDGFLVMPCMIFACRRY